MWGTPDPLLVPNSNRALGFVVRIFKPELCRSVEAGYSYSSLATTNLVY